MSTRAKVRMTDNDGDCRAAVRHVLEADLIPVGERIRPDYYFPKPVDTGGFLEIVEKAHAGQPT